MVRTLTLLVLVVLVSGHLRADQSIVFEKHVRPILKANCFHCHGEEGNREGKLDLRLRRLIVEGGESGAAIEPGNVAASYLLERVQTGEMPPGDKKLAEQDVQTIEAWIAQGAKTARAEPESIGDGPLFTEEERQFWSFQPIRRPELPAVASPNRARTPIDHFVLDRLEHEGLAMSADADRVTLIRRVYFDLLGLPPLPEVIESFVADRSPISYEQLVDQLLASPHYGERWGRHWLDVAGYADSEGGTEEDQVRSSAFRYRDYVVCSFNDDKPFDQFIREQLAGDEMVPAPFRNLSAEAIEKLTATGFLRMAPDPTAASEIDQNVARNEVIADTIKIVSTSLLGLTVGCARCHDHRYDPISQVDYYQMRAILEPAYDWKNWRAPPDRLISMYTDAERELANQIEAKAAVVDHERAAKVRHYIDRTLEEELATLDEALRQPLRVAYKLPEDERTAAQKRLLQEYPSTQSISEDSLYLYDRRRQKRANQIDTERVAKEQRILEETSREHPGETVTLETLRQFNPAAADDIERDKATAAQLRAETSASNLEPYTKRAAEIRAEIPKEGFIRALTEPASPVPATFVFERGDHEQPKAQIQPNELAILGLIDLPTNDTQLSTTGRRLAYARHLTNGHHPLVARVIVNQIWMGHFGRGLVNSPGNFGFLGERPTHPELLDWLADEFMRGGWQVKRLHKLIMLSSVYRQSSRRTEGLDAVDPNNRLYARMSIQRLESEAIRDSILAVSGDLNQKMYGEPVPVMEDKVGQIVLGQETLDAERIPTETIPLHGEEFRRSLYVQVRRSRPLGVLETFDTPVMTPNCPIRSTSNVAPQSLMLMNNQFIIDQAARFARRVQTEVGDDLPSQIIRAWLLALGRRPSADEVTSAEAYVEKQAKSFTAKQENTDPVTAQHDALSTLCQALISANRFIYID